MYVDPRKHSPESCTSPICPEDPDLRIVTKFGLRSQLADVTMTNCGSIGSSALSLQRPNSQFPHKKRRRLL